MEANKVSYKYDPLCKIQTISDYTTSNSYIPVMVIDTSKHPSFVLQLINKHISNAITYKITTLFESGYETEIKATTDIISSNNTIYEDESIGIKTIVYAKSKVDDNPGTLKIFLRLKPASFIV